MKEMSLRNKSCTNPYDFIRWTASTINIIFIHVHVFFRAYLLLYTLILTHYLQCIHEYDVVNVCVLVQTFQDRYSNLLILLFFETFILENTD